MCESNTKQPTPHGLAFPMPKTNLPLLLLLQEESKSWDEAFAGLVDADGCLLVNQAGYTSLEVTMGIGDEHALLQIKQKLQGSVKLRSKARA